MTIEKWDTCEFSFTSKTQYENPFTEVDLSATFTHANGRVITVHGFFDGDDTWRVRFMPLEEGDWTFDTRSNDAALNGQRGSLTCVPPTKDYLRGPVHTEGHHFFRADGSPHYVLSTRLSCHWAEPRVWMDAITYLKEHRITRVFFIMGGVHGTVDQLYGEGHDFDRYCLEKFQAIDRFIDALRKEDVLAGPYFYYFNDGSQRELTPEQDRAYIKYGMARFGAYCNVLPCLSNEVEQKFTTRKGEYDLRSHEWCNEMGPFMKDLAVFGQAVTVHNPMETDNATNPGFYTLLYDWPFPWTDYMMRQSQLAALSTVPEIRDDIPESKTPAYNFRGYSRHNQLFIDLHRFGIPMINEEPGYEMEGRVAIPGRMDVLYRPWNSQSDHTLVPTFWSAACAGGYVMWGNYATYWLDDPLPGIKRSLTPKRLKILHDCMIALPYYEMEPNNDLVSANTHPMGGQDWRTNFCLAKVGEAYLVFSLFGGDTEIDLAEGSYQVRQLDPRTGEEADLGTLGGGKRMVNLVGVEQVLIIRS